MSGELLVGGEIKIADISGALKEMPEPRGFILPDGDRGVKPQFAKKISALYMLMHWPFINQGSDAPMDEETGVYSSGFSMYAALVEHGKKYVAEVFVFNEKTQQYQGSIKAYSVELPENLYNEGYDDWLMDELAKRVTGVTKENCLGHNI